MISEGERVKLSYCGIRNLFSFYLYVYKMFDEIKFSNNNSYSLCINLSNPIMKIFIMLNHRYSIISITLEICC